MNPTSSQFTFAGGTILLALALSLSAPGAEETPAGERWFTACNIWYEQPEKVWSTNYQKGSILPAGSEVAHIRRSGEAITFVDVKTNVKFTVLFVAKHHPGENADSIADRLFSHKGFEDLVAGFTQDEIEAIKSGEIRNGMSKKAVLIARGHPPEIRTRSTDLDIWVYWYDRFRYHSIQFADGKLVSTGKT